MTELPSRRAVCALCLRPVTACICRWIVPLAARVELLVLQHPLETGNAKNSARLLHLSVTGSVLVVGERFDAAALDALLFADGRQPLLLYPDTPDDTARDVVAVDGADPARLRLVVLDATWRKSRKMLHLNPSLGRLPRLALDMASTAPRAYRIRKAHAPHQLSTLEAAVHALAKLERRPLYYQPLLAAFDGFVQQQAAHMPHLNPE